MTQATPSAAESLREQILSAAHQCFRERGFKCATMHHIAKRAGMSVGNLYNYFGGKEAIIDEMAQREVGRLAREVGEVVEGCVTIEEQLEKCYESLMSQMTLERARIKIDILEEVDKGNERLGEIVCRYDSQVRELIKKMHRDRREDLSEEELEVQVNVAMALFDGLSLRFIANPEMNREQTARVVAEMIVR